MIFVSVGTHEQPFDRLITEIDRIKGNNVIHDDIFMQLGYTKYVPAHCSYKAIIGYNEMVEKIKGCRIFITHGGPGSIFLAIQNGKGPIVVPRMREFNEHVDNHQVSFAKKLESESKILAVYQIEKLQETICQYGELIRKYKTFFMEDKTKSSTASLVAMLDRFCIEMSEK